MGDAGHIPNHGSSGVPKVGYLHPNAETLLLSRKQDFNRNPTHTVNRTEPSGPGGSKLVVLETGMLLFVHFVSAIWTQFNMNSASCPTANPRLPSADREIHKAPFASRP